MVAARPISTSAIKLNTLDALRAERLAEIRRAQSMTQSALADAMLVAQSRISQIESADIARTELGTIRSYVEALGGRLDIVASFGDETVRLTN